MPSIVALIPARAGSKRIPHKNTRYLGGKPLIVWTIEAAKESRIFDSIIVCSDDLECQGIATVCDVNFWQRPPVPDDQPDVEWVTHLLCGHLWEREERYDVFAILRPTSPFRTAATIRRAWQHFLDNQPADSLRAIEPVKQHPGKMWVRRGGRLLPILPWQNEDAPWQSSPTQSLPEVYVQNASLEIAWTKTVREGGGISGTNIVPFLATGHEGFDINTEADWYEAERISAGALLQWLTS